jgi:hypothetical protein
MILKHIKLIHKTVVSLMKWLKDLARGKPLIRCHLSLKLKGIYERSDSHRDEENRRSQRGMRINGCVDCVHLHFSTAANSHCFTSAPGLACFAIIVKQDIVFAFINPA